MQALLYRNCSGFQILPRTSAAGASLAAEQPAASARSRKRQQEGAARQAQAAAGPLVAGVSGSSAVQLDSQRVEDRGEQQSKRHCTGTRVQGQTGERDPSPRESALESSATLSKSQDDSMDS